MTWVWQRIHDIYTDAYPKERLLCILSFSIRLVCILAPALATWEWFPLLVSVHNTRLQALLPGLAAYLAGYLGAFVYADLGPEEWLRKWTVGHSYDPSIWPIGTLEGYCGGVSRGLVTWHGYTKTALEWWQEYKGFPLAPWWGDPGSGKFGAE